MSDLSLSKEDILFKINQINKSKSIGSHFCAMIASHDEQNIRKKMIDIIEHNIGKVDCPGMMYNNDPTLKTMEAKGGDYKIEYLRRYKFTICPENSIADGYVTEKLLHAFIAGVVPIYYGYSNDPEPGIFNKDAIMYLDVSQDNSSVIRKIKAINDDHYVRHEFLEQIKILPGSEEKIFNMCINTVNRIISLIN